MMLPPAVDTRVWQSIQHPDRVHGTVVCRTPCEILKSHIQWVF